MLHAIFWRNAIFELIKSVLESPLGRYASVATLVVRGWWIRSLAHICPPCLCVILRFVGFFHDFWSSMRRWLLGLRLGCPHWFLTKPYGSTVCQMSLIHVGEGGMFRPRYWCKQSYCLCMLMDCHGNRLDLPANHMVGNGMLICVCVIYIYIFVCWICLFKFIIHSESIGYMICVNTDTWKDETLFLVCDAHTDIYIYMSACSMYTYLYVYLLIYYIYIYIYYTGSNPGLSQNPKLHQTLNCGVMAGVWCRGSLRRSWNVEPLFAVG